MFYSRQRWIPQIAEPAEVAEPIPQSHGTETAESRNHNREVAEPILYTDHYSDHHKQISNPSCPEASQPDAESSSPVEQFLAKHPEAVTWNVQRQWGSQDDLTCAELTYGEKSSRCTSRPLKVTVK